MIVTHVWRSILPTAIALALGLLAWQLVVAVSDGWVPTLGEIWQALGETVRDRSVWDNLLVTLQRILIAFAGAMAVGCVLGIGMGLSPSAEAFFRPLVVIALAVPDPVYIILSALTIGLTQTAAMVALIAALSPFVAMIVVGAVKGRDRGLDEMAAVFGLPRARYLREVLGGQIAPALMAAARVAFGFSWKLVVLVEALTQSDGIGSEIYSAFRLLRPADMIALAIVFIVVMGVLSQAVLRAADRRLFAWK